MPSDLAASARQLIDDFTARLKELEKGSQGSLVKYMRQNQKTIVGYGRYVQDAQAEHSRQEKMSPQDAGEIKRAEGNIQWYRNTLLSAENDNYWRSHQHNAAWVEYDELRTEMDKISKLVGRPRRAARSLGKSVFVPQYMRTYRRVAGY
ncbi:hypothetical protein JCM9279_001757 [Rhodotorula babjevae]